MRFLKRYGNLIEWGSAIVIVVAMVLWQLRIWPNGLVGVIVVIGMVVYWAAFLPRLLSEHKP